MLEGRQSSKLFIWHLVVRVLVRAHTETKVYCSALNKTLQKRSMWMSHIANISKKSSAHHTYIHTYIYIHTNIHTYDLNSFKNTHIHTYIAGEGGAPGLKFWTPDFLVGSAEAFVVGVESALFEEVRKEDRRGTLLMQGNLP